MRKYLKPIPPIDAKTEARFWNKVEKREDGIWQWLGAKLRDGHGTFSIARSTYIAHRVAWVLNQRRLGLNQDIPVGMILCHVHDVSQEVCDVNPNNLWLGTDKENVLDCVKKGRHPRRGGAKRPLRGEHAPTAVLKEEDIPKIRDMRGHRNAAKLGRLFGVDPTTIIAIWKRKTWKHVA